MIPNRKSPKSVFRENRNRNEFSACIFFAILLLPLMFFQCSIEKPTAPTWNVKLSVPLINLYYDMATLIDKMDEPYLKVDSLGNPGFYFEEDLDTIRLAGKLSCNSTTLYFKDTLGIIDIHASESKSIVLSAAEFYSGPPGIVPPCTAKVESDLDTFTSYSQVTVKEAYATLNLSNQLGLDLDWVEINIIDQVLRDTLKTLILPLGIASGDSVNQSIVFNDQSFSNHLGIQLIGSTPGGEIQSLVDKHLFLNFTIDSLKVIQGTAKVPTFEVLEEKDIPLPTRSLIDSALIKSGNLYLNLQNFTNLSSELHIDFPELVKDGVILSGECHLPAQGYSDLAFVLDRYTYKPGGGNKINVQTTIWSNGSGDDQVDFNSSDSVSINTLLSEVVFSQIAGVIESTRIKIENITKDLNIPPGFEHAHLTHASLNMKIHNGVDLPANLSVHIQGDQQQQLNLTAQIDAGSPFGTSVTSLYEDHLESLFNPVPKTLTITGDIICGDGQTFGIVREENFFFGRLKVSSPLEMVLDSCQVKLDEDSEEVNDDMKDLIENQVNSSLVVFKIESHLPLDANVRILISRNSESLFSIPDLIVGPVYVPKGELNPDGSVKKSNSHVGTINLTHSELQVFTGAPFYMAGRIDFPGTDGKTIKSMAADFITITSYLELNVKNKKE